MLLFRLLPYAVFFFAFSYSLGCPQPAPGRAFSHSAP